MAATAKQPDGGEGQSRPETNTRRPDRISSQPDAVLETIVSFLPTRAGCRTQALSRRWRPIWRSAPLKLDTDIGCGGLPEQTISDILSEHHGRVSRISITGITPVPHRYDNSARTHVVDEEARDARTRFEGRLSSPNVLAGLQVLHLGYSHGNDVLPLSLFHLAPALREASFRRCRLPPNLAVNFPSLEKLSLRKVTLTEEALAAMLVGCPTLRSLLMEETVGSARLRVNSPSLRSIGFCALLTRRLKSYGIVRVQELVIEDAPCLQRLLPIDSRYGPATIRVVQAPKLEVLGCLSRGGTSQLHLGTTVFQEMIATSLTTTIPTVKVLVLDQVGPNLDAVLDFLKCFPCLERLYIVLDPKDIKVVRKYTLANNPIECLGSHLKKVALKVYHGTSVEVDFARFFVLNARVLERMEFGIVNNRKDEWRNDLNLQLQLEDRASRDARFEFKKFTRNTFRNNNKHAHDLSMADPFDASFLEGFVTLPQSYPYGGVFDQSVVLSPSSRSAGKHGYWMQSAPDGRSGFLLSGFWVPVH